MDPVGRSASSELVGALGSSTSICNLQKVNLVLLIVSWNESFGLKISFELSSNDMLIDFDVPAAQMTLL